jgi:hypothetical protein
VKVPNSKLQIPMKLQAPNFKGARAVHGLVLGYWNFFGTWNLEFGAFVA